MSLTRLPNLRASFSRLFRRPHWNTGWCVSTLGLLLLVGAVAACVLLLPFEALARVGGGHSYGGSRGGGSGGSGGSGDGGAIIGIVRMLIWLTVEYPLVGVPVDVAVVGFVVYRFARGGKKTAEAFSSAPSGTSTGVMAFPLGLDMAALRADGFNREFAQLRKFDPNFSEIVFTDFCYALYGKAHHARGHGPHSLDQFSPYLSDAARKALLQRNPKGLKEVKGIIVGAMSIAEISGLETPLVKIALLFESNYTEVVNANGGSPAEMTYYVRERWQLERKRDVLSPTPAQATALHCPKCGAPLQKDTVGACAFCGTKVESGEFQWYVRGVFLLSSEAKGPLLTSDIPEAGTNLPSVVQPGFREVRLEFEKNNPGFSWGEFQARARLIFDELQAAWSALNWERARPHETDNLFQMHQYWIDAYKRQHLRNVLDQCRVTALQPVRIKEDAFYISITLRIGAQGYDYTVNERGDVVSGSNTATRYWSEYWTFIRSRKAKTMTAKAELNCPNCGAPLRVNNAGICEFCGGKITSGEFDWVLSRIEQDESYRG
ncbi:MAG TPA: TIM44-like domain-containing protein [Pyrinomonadaceae bacterium]|nr:TIM44-like domain-containing protein [Pyrinomonadaceae bacterium]